MNTGPVNEMLARNSKMMQMYQSPPMLPEMAATSRATGSGVIVLSCCDPRVNPYQILGIEPTMKATMIRNAGGRVMDAIRSIIALQTMSDPKTIIVMHHTDCGMTHYHDSAIRKSLMDMAPEERMKIMKMKFGEIMDVDESIREDLEMLRMEPLIKKSTQLVGVKFDTMTGMCTIVN